MTGGKGAGRAPLVHGGDLADAARLAGAGSGEDWLDLSTGINPTAYPMPDIPAAVWQRLPGAADLAAMRSAACAFYGVPAQAALMAAPGTESLINTLPLLFGPRTVQIVAPTYGSHAPAWARAGHKVHEIAHISQADPAAVSILVNPNNPDGRIVGASDVATFVSSVRGAGGLVVVDEAYGEVAPDVSAVHLCAGEGLIVLRSFGKFFGLAGLRLGFAIGAAGMIGRLSALLGDWPVSGPAATIGATALADLSWHSDMRATLAKRARAARDLCARNGLKIAGGTDLFLLIEAERAGDLFEHLLARRIYVRIFPNRDNWLRFGIPAGDAALARLDAALSNWR